MVELIILTRIPMHNKSEVEKIRALEIYGQSYVFVKNFLDYFRLLYTENG